MTKAQDCKFYTFLMKFYMGNLSNSTLTVFHFEDPQLFKNIYNLIDCNDHVLCTKIIHIFYYYCSMSQLNILGRGCSHTSKNDKK